MQPEELPKPQPQPQQPQQPQQPLEPQEPPPPPPPQQQQQQQPPHPQQQQQQQQQRAGLPAWPRATPLPPLLAELQEQLAEPAGATSHQQAMWKLFAQHELAMQIVQTASAPRKYSKKRVAELAKSATRRGDRVALEKEEMALRRKFVLKPASLSV